MLDYIADSKDQFLFAGSENQNSAYLPLKTKYDDVGDIKKLFSRLQVHYGWNSGLAFTSQQDGNACELKSFIGRWTDTVVRFFAFSEIYSYLSSSFTAIFTLNVNFSRTQDEMAACTRNRSDNWNSCASWCVRVYMLPVGSPPDPWQSTSWHQRYCRRQRVRRVVGDGQSNYLRLTAGQFIVRFY